MTEESVVGERLVLIGAGGLATSLAFGLQRYWQEGQLVQIYSPGGASARELARQLGGSVSVAGTLDEVETEATGYILAVPDDALAEVAEALSARVKGYLLHCSGATPLEVISSRHPRSGVLYPLSTFSRGRVVDTKEVPFYLEVAEETLTPSLTGLAQALAEEIHWASSEQRLILHLGAVIACNFSNHLIAISEHLLQQYDLPPKALLPLLDEMIDKLHRLPAQAAQSGPARRGDVKTIDRHRAVLADQEELLRIYDLFTERIRRTN